MTGGSVQSPPVFRDPNDIGRDNVRAWLRMDFDWQPFEPQPVTHAFVFVVIHSGGPSGSGSAGSMPGDPAEHLLAWIDPGSSPSAVTWMRMRPEFRQAR